MNSEKEVVLVKQVGIVSAVVLILLLLGVSYFLVRSQQSSVATTEPSTPSEEPSLVRDGNERDVKLLYAAAEQARLKEDGKAVQIGVPLEGHSGVYVVDVQAVEGDGRYYANEFGEPEVLTRGTADFPSAGIINDE